LIPVKAGPRLPLYLTLYIVAGPGRVSKCHVTGKLWNSYSSVPVAKLVSQPAATAATARFWSCTDGAE